MSDIYATEYYAIVWDEKEQAPVDIPFSSSFELVTECGTAEVDADEATLAAYRAWEAAKAEAREKQGRERLVQRLISKHSSAALGTEVIVLKGRKVPKGTIGTVFWLKNGRAGVRTSDRKDARGRWVDVVWVDADYLGNTEKFNLSDHWDPSDPHFQEMDAYAQSLLS